MTKPPMNPAGALAALEKIRPPRDPYAIQKCLSKMRLIAHFARFDAKDSPIEKSFSNIAEDLGMAVKTTRARLDELVEDRVLQKEESAGSRACAYRLEPDIRRWRGFDWAVPVSLVEQEVGFATGEYRRVEPKRPTHVYRARQKRFVNPSIESSPKSSSRDPLWSGSQTKPSSADLPGEGVHKSPGSSKSPETLNPLSSLTEEEREVLQKVCGLVMRKTRGIYVNGPPLNTLAWLVQQGVSEHDVAALLASAPDGMGVPRATNWLYLQWKSRDIRIENAPEVIDLVDPEERKRNRELEAANYRNQIIHFESQGLHDEAEHFREKLKTLEDNQQMLEA